MTKYGRPLLCKNSYFIWRQVEHIATYLDTMMQSAWDIQAIGTDYEGIINPLNGWWSAKEMPILGKYLEQHAKDFLNSPRGKKLRRINQLTAQEIVIKFMYQNAKIFIDKNFT